MSPRMCKQRPCCPLELFHTLVIPLAPLWITSAILGTNHSGILNVYIMMLLSPLRSSEYSLKELSAFPRKSHGSLNRSGGKAPFLIFYLSNFSSFKCDVSIQQYPRR